MRSLPDCVARLQAAGIAYADAIQLRRISMTLHRWHELECGDSDDYKSYSLVRGRRDCPFNEAIQKREAVFTYDEDNGAPYIETHFHNQTAPHYTRVADRENGAKRRLARILAKYPGLSAYIQTDPRGCALYILRPGDVWEGQDPSSCYTNGVAVYK